MPQFDVTTFSSQIFWLLVCVSVLFWYVRNVFMPRISMILEERKNIIEKATEAADTLTKSASYLEAEYQQALENANRAAFALKAQAREKVDKFLDSKLKEISGRNKIETKYAQIKLTENLGKCLASEEVDDRVFEISGILLSSMITSRKINRDLLRGIVNKLHS